jgi:hypothetical protein
MNPANTAELRSLTPPHRWPRSEAVEGTVYPLPAPVEAMGVDHRRADVTMPEQFLHRPDVVAVFQQVRRKGVPKRVTAHRLNDAHASRGLFDGPLQDRFVDVMPPPLPGPRIHADL